MPIHPQLVHFPLALAFVLPVLALIVALGFYKQKLTANVWFLIAGLQVFATISGYAALKTGEDDEKIARKTIQSSIIHEHEERAEMFIAFSVAAMALAIATCLVKVSVKFPMMLITIAVMAAQLGLAVRTGESGGELVYIHHAANAHKVVVDPVEEVELNSQDENSYKADETTETEEDRENDTETDE